MQPSRRAQLLAAAVVVTALTAAQADATPRALSYHGSIRIDYRYTSGGALTPGSAPDVEQTAHLTLTVKGNRITHLHGVVGFDYKQYYELCPSFLVETTGGGTVDAKPDLGGSYAFLDFNWHPKGRYVTPEPAVPPAKVTSQTTKPDQSCASVSETDRATFELGYVPILSGHTRTPKRVVGSLTRNHQGSSACHPFSPLPPPPPEGVSCTWRLRWTLVRGR
jgi:hypothetical protein